jgi:hypothetical protein
MGVPCLFCGGTAELGLLLEAARDFAQAADYFLVQNGQRRPSFSVARLKLDGFLERNARKQVILRAASLLGEKAPPDSFVGRESFRRLFGRGRGDRTSKHAIHIGNRAANAISDFVLQIEDSLRLPDTVFLLGGRTPMKPSHNPPDSTRSGWLRLRSAPPFSEIASAR